jgi:hypothetical protein
MTPIADLIARMRENPGGVRFIDLCKVCDYFFGQARQTSGSHRVYKTPWIGATRVSTSRITRDARKPIR